MPATNEAVPGVTVILVRLELETVRDPLPAIAPDVALIIVLPAATAVARPAAVIVAAAGLLLDQVTFDVQSAALPSL